MTATRDTSRAHTVVVENPIAESPTDPQESLGALFRDLRTSDSGLSGREAQRRRQQILPSTHGDQCGVIGSAAMVLDDILTPAMRPTMIR